VELKKGKMMKLMSRRRQEEEDDDNKRQNKFVFTSRPSLYFLEERHSIKQGVTGRTQKDYLFRRLPVLQILCY
jgi:hypothetical protein